MPLPRDPPKLGEDCYCRAPGKTDGRYVKKHPLDTTCVESCDFDCGALRLPITIDELKRALIHNRDHVYQS